jgi:hypothetical protein
MLGVHANRAYVRGLWPEIQKVSTGLKKTMYSGDYAAEFHLYPDVNVFQYIIKHRETGQALMTGTETSVQDAMRIALEALERLNAAGKKARASSTASSDQVVS